MIDFFRQGKYRVLSRNSLKLIAVITMVVDHIGFCFVAPSTTLYIIMRHVIGRIAWPLFAMMIVEGLFRTKHPWRHVLILLATAIVSEPFYDFMNSGTFFWTTKQNIIWIYILTAIFICFIRSNRIHIVPKVTLCIAFGGVSIYLSEWLRFSGGGISCAGILVSALIYLYLKSALASTAVASITWSYENNTPGGMLAFIVALFYNPNKECCHSPVLKYSFYAFYPFHLLVLGALKLII